MKGKRRPIEIFSLSFLDVISCGFGAIILLLVLALALEPATLERITTGQTEKIAQIENARHKMVAERQDLSRKLAGKKAILLEVRQRLSQLNQEWSHVQKQEVAAQTKAKNQSNIQKELETVLQTLSTEMDRLLSQKEYQPPSKDAMIGGIPVDSEYIIFIVDTSGSMLRMAWPMVIKKVEQVLSIYPRLKGIQIMNDMGRYMFSEYAGKWIPDTPARRKAVLSRLRKWKSFSNSSPVEGVTHAVRRYFKKDKRISLYVFGDDFSQGSINEVIREVARLNKKDASGKPRVRIHTFGFPVLFLHPIGKANRTRFAHLMRLLAEQNAGSFVGLTNLR